MTEDRIRQWHRLFGIALTDLFQETPWQVELERDLALQRQLLDVVIIERRAAPGVSGAELPELPDGLEGLREHNLLTYKSRREALDGWALDELLGHYVNYRKQASPERDLLPAARFRLYAVATRHPRGLGRAQVLRETAWPGVYDVAWGTRTIRLIVLNGIATHPRNAPWELFATGQERIRHGARHYRRRRAAAWDLLRHLYLTYVLEEPGMAYTMDEFVRETRQQFLASLTLEERLAILSELPPEERLRGLPPEERLRGLTPEELRQLEEYLKRLH
jgi:hypothetical protein